MSDVESRAAGEKSLLSRRNVIGTALWAAPAITLATAAPALAATSAGDALTLSGWSAVRSSTGLLGSNNTLTVNFSVAALSYHTPPGGGDTAVITMTMTLPIPALCGVAYPATVGAWKLQGTPSSTTTTVQYQASLVGNNPASSLGFNGAFTCSLLSLGLGLATWTRGAQVSLSGVATDSGAPRTWALSPANLAANISIV